LIINFIRKIKPKYVIQIGDLYDFFAWAKWPRKREIYTAEAEVEMARDMAEDFWRSVTNASKRSKRFQIRGNHDERPYKRIAEKLPEFTLLSKHIDELFDFPGVESTQSQRDEIILGDKVFMHGYRAKLGDHARHNGMSTICGHSHLGGCVNIRLGNRTIWELNAGFVADESSVPLSYTDQRKFSRWTQGFGYIDQYGPRFIPLPND